MNNIVSANRTETLGMDRILLPEKHPEIMNMYEALRLERKVLGSDSPASQRKRKLGQTWPQKHKSACDAMGVNFEEVQGPPKELHAAYPGLYKLTDRQIEILVIKGVRFPERIGRSIDLSQTINRGHLKEGFGCAKPGMCSYITSRCRTTVGVESLLMQGIHYGEQQARLEEFPDNLKQDLGGNSFEALAWDNWILDV